MAVEEQVALPDILPGQPTGQSYTDGETGSQSGSEVRQWVRFAVLPIESPLPAVIHEGQGSFSAKYSEVGFVKQQWRDVGDEVNARRAFMASSVRSFAEDDGDGRQDWRPLFCLSETAPHGKRPTLEVPRRARSCSSRRFFRHSRLRSLCAFAPPILCQVLPMPGELSDAVRRSIEAAPAGTLAPLVQLSLGYSDPDGTLELTSAELVLPYPVRRLESHETIEDVDEATIQEMFESAPAPEPLPEIVESQSPRMTPSRPSTALKSLPSLGRGTAARAEARKVARATTTSASGP